MAEQPKSALIIQFAAPGSALFNMHPEGVVTPEQLVVVGEFLLTRARAMWRLQLEEAMATAEAAVRDATAELESARNNLIIIQKSDVVSKNVRDREFEHTWYENNYGNFLKAYERGKETKDRVEWEWNALLAARERLDAARAEAAKALGDAENRVAKAEDALQESQIAVLGMHPGQMADILRGMKE